MELLEEFKKLNKKKEIANFIRNNNTLTFSNSRPVKNKEYTYNGKPAQYLGEWEDGHRQKSVVSLKKVSEKEAKAIRRYLLDKWVEYNNSTSKYVPFDKEEFKKEKRLWGISNKELIKKINRLYGGKIEGESKTTSSIYSNFKKYGIRLRISRHEEVAKRSFSDLSVVLRLDYFEINLNKYNVPDEATKEEYQNLIIKKIAPYFKSFEDENGLSDKPKSEKSKKKVNLTFLDKFFGFTN